MNSIACVTPAVTTSLVFAAPVTASEPYIEMPVAVSNARQCARTRSLDCEGFMLARHAARIADFYDPVEVREVYYRAIEEFIREATGASVVSVFTHSIRCAPKADKGSQGVQRPFKFVHNDYTTASGPLRAREALGSRADALNGRRFCILNLWRPIRGPVEESPLALCDAQTVLDRDLVAVPSKDPTGRVIRIYALAFNPQQRWWYFPMMDTEELLVFKTFDSRQHGSARFTFHSAFTDPNTSPDAEPRESIEVRAVAAFEGDFAPIESTS